MLSSDNILLYQPKEAMEISHASQIIRNQKRQEKTEDFDQIVDEQPNAVWNDWRIFSSERTMLVVEVYHLFVDLYIKIQRPRFTQSVHLIRSWKKCNIPVVVYLYFFLFFFLINGINFVSSKLIFVVLAAEKVQAVNETSLICVHFQHYCKYIYADFVF